MIILLILLQVALEHVHLSVHPIVQTYVKLQRVATALDVVLDALAVEHPVLQVVTEDVLVIVLNFVPVAVGHV